ncbi:hypothetical protein QP157_14390 [Sphingomonas sp. LR61]|uniref:hypothetical protein n=1 Tax=Sphingomonas sp. LR61 TaxID=3050234 RepID=UPI002FE1BA2D
MLRIDAQPAPRKFTELRAARAPYSKFSSEPSIRRRLWEQQGGRCAYCERKLRRWDHVNHRTRIEHFHPQHGLVWTATCKGQSGASDHESAPTTWKNMLLCCNGQEHLAETDLHRCDKKKDNTDVCEDFRNPRDWHGYRLVDVKRSGKAFAVSGLPHGAQNVIDSVININDPDLVKTRRNLWASLEKKVAHLYQASVADRAAVAAYLREQAKTAAFATTYLSLADRFDPSI